MTEAAQFGVHRSPSRSPVKPFVIVLQSDDFHRMPTRVVASLVIQEAMVGLEGEQLRIAPRLAIRGRGYILNPLDIATIGLSRLGRVVASFVWDDDAKHRIQDALDAALKPL